MKRNCSGIKKKYKLSSDPALVKLFHGSVTFDLVFVLASFGTFQNYLWQGSREKFSIWRVTTSSPVPYYICCAAWIFTSSQWRGLRASSARRVTTTVSALLPADSVCNWVPWGLLVVAIVARTANKRRQFV